MDGSSAMVKRFLDRLRDTASAIRPIATFAGSDPPVSRIESRPGDRGGVQLVPGRPGPTRRAWLPLVSPAALAYLAKHHTEATRAEPVPILGLSRPESVPNLWRDSPLCSRANRTRGEISWHWNSPLA